MPLIFFIDLKSEKEGVNFEKIREKNEFCFSFKFYMICQKAVFSKPQQKVSNLLSAETKANKWKIDELRAGKVLQRQCRQIDRKINICGQPRPTKSAVCVSVFQSTPHWDEKIVQKFECHTINWSSFEFDLTQLSFNQEDQRNYLIPTKTTALHCAINRATLS